MHHADPISHVLQGELVSQLRDVVRVREATIAQLHNEQQQAGIMLEAVRAERDRLQHQVNLNSPLFFHSICVKL